MDPRICAARHWALDPNLGGLTSTHVLNTDLLLNLTGAGAGRCAAVSGRGAVRSAAAADELAVLAADNSPDDPAVAAAVRQSAAAVDEAANHPLTEAAAEFCGQGDNNAAWYSWLAAAVLLLLCLCWTPAIRSYARAVKAATAPVARRLALAERRSAVRLWLTTICCALVISGGQLWWDLVASQPPRLSEAQPVSLAADGLVHIPLTQVRDGKLHRFVWVADDGKAVRFLSSTAIPTNYALAWYLMPACCAAIRDMSWKVIR
jgi:uncharacterized membrane protein